MSALVLRPADLLDPHGFQDGLLCAALVEDQTFASSTPSRVMGGAASGYASSRHLLRHLVVSRLLPLFPWSSSMVVWQDPHGSPVYLWLRDDDGCPLRSREREVRQASPVVLEDADIRTALARVYPLRTPAQAGLYAALAFPPAEHETALALLAPFTGLDDDVLVLAAEIYSAARPAGAMPVLVPYEGYVDGASRDVVLTTAGRLFDVIADARSLVH